MTDSCGSKHSLSLPYPQHSTRHDRGGTTESELDLRLTISSSARNDSESCVRDKISLLLSTVSSVVSSQVKDEKVRTDS